MIVVERNWRILVRYIIGQIMTIIPFYLYDPCCFIMLTLSKDVFLCLALTEAESPM